MATPTNFHHETRQGVIPVEDDRNTHYRDNFGVSRERLEVLAELGKPGEPYRIDKRMIDGRTPFLRTVSQVSGPQRWRAGSTNDSESDPVAFVLAPKVGGANIVHAGKEVALRPGQYTVCISNEPRILSFSASCEIILGFITDVCMVQDRQLTRCIGREMSLEGVGRLLVQHLDGALRIAHALDSPGLEAASNAAGSLLPATLFSGSSSYSPSSDALHDRITTYIELKLHETGLSARQIAAEHHVSVRTVYRLFDKSELGVAAYIRARRMERCRTEVEERLDLSLAAICLRWGIADPKHFARQYRTYFGESPSDARRRLHRSVVELEASQQGVPEPRPRSRPAAILGSAGCPAN